jgi:hypothetical protein
MKQRVQDAWHNLVWIRIPSTAPDATTKVLPKKDLLHKDWSSGGVILYGYFVSTTYCSIYYECGSLSSMHISDDLPRT